MKNAAAILSLLSILAIANSAQAQKTGGCHVEIGGGVVCNRPSPTIPTHLKCPSSLRIDANFEDFRVLVDAKIKRGAFADSLTACLYAVSGAGSSAGVVTILDEVQLVNGVVRLRFEIAGQKYDSALLTNSMQKNPAATAAGYYKSVGEFLVFYPGIKAVATNYVDIKLSNVIKKTSIDLTAPNFISPLRF